MNNLETGTLKSTRQITEIFGEQLRRGHSVRMNIKGRSMHPFIQREDIVIVRPIRFEEARTGDIIAYSRRLGDGFTAHRVIGKRRDQQGREHLFTLADASIHGDFPVYPEDVYGKVATIERTHGRIIDLETRLNRLSSYLIAYLSWAWAALKGAISSPARFLKKLWG